MQLELCTYSQDMVEDSLQTSSLDTNQSSLLSGMGMPAKSSENEQQMDGSPACECGKETSECSIHPSTPEAWTLFMRDSLARILALPENRQALALKRAVAFTVKSSESLAWFDQNSCSWKTCQQSLITDSEQSWQTLPRSGMTRNGFAYELPIVGRITTETGGGYLPTPTSSEPQLERRAKHGTHYQTENGTIRRKNEDGTSSMLGLAGYVKYWPTPNASDCRDRWNMSMPSIQRRAAIGKQLNLSMVVDPTSGALNPQFVEWLMGFPIGFTDSKDWATPKSRSKRQSPTVCSEVSE